MIAAPLRHKHFLWSLLALAVVYVAVHAFIVSARVRFPYDTFIWSESPFLTNMLKLHNGVEIYGPAADANSFVYSPGLEYLCFAVLSPFGLHLDVTACRVVNVAVALAAAILAGTVMTSLVRETTTAMARRVVLLLTIALSALIIFKNFTADVCHPDNLHMLLMAAGMALGLRAIWQSSFPLACLTAALLGAGILLKQTCAFAGIGGALFLAAYGYPRWGALRAAAVLGAALATTALSASWLLIHHEHGRFWLYEVLSRHDAAISKIDALTTFEAHLLYRLPLYATAPVCAVHGLMSNNERLRHATGYWLFLGLFGAAPGVAAYIKTFGLWNNLVVIDLWAAFMVVPTFIAVSHERLEHRPDRALGVLAMAALAVVTLALYPTKRRPTADHLRYGRQLESALREDRASGRKVLVAHGTAAYIRAGFLDVPLDRSNTILELDAAGLEDKADTGKRFAAGHYDKIYLAWPTYADHDAALKAAYFTRTMIPQSTIKEQTMVNGLSTAMLVQIAIYERRPR